MSYSACFKYEHGQTRATGQSMFKQELCCETLPEGTAVKKRLKTPKWSAMADLTGS